MKHSETEFDGKSQRRHNETGPEPAIVQQTRSALLRCADHHEWPGVGVRERATADMLALVATVPYTGNDDAYRTEVWDLVVSFLNPVIEKIRTDVALLRMPTTKTIH